MASTGVRVPSRKATAEDLQRARAPNRKATAEDLQQARKELGPAVGQRAFIDYVKRHYGQVQESTARDFLRTQPINQVFAAPPKSEGRVVTTGRLDDWHLDLMSLPKGDPEYKYIMIAQNVYTGYIFARPLVNTTTTGEGGTAAVFDSMLADSARVGQGPPQAVTTDGSNAEWQGAFKEQLQAKGIVHRVKQKEDRNAMGKLDATIQQLRAQLMRPAVETPGPWSARLPEVVRVYNNLLGHEGSFGSPPVDVIGDNPREMSEDNVLDFQVMRKMARGLKQNSELNKQNRDKVMGEGAFRHALPYWRDAVKAGRNVR